MNRSIVALFAVASLSAMANTPPEITNVRASQREGTKLVDIYYDAADADGDALKIRMEISDNDGVKYSVPALTFTGDIGEGVAPGKNKHIVWDAGTDWDGEYSDQMRVKIYAIDAQGFPGLEWGNEVPPGGFLMGQDGGAEGSGPSRHINVPWSYWLSKYEITVGQYCDFLNAAYQAGNVYLVGTSTVRSAGSSVFEGYCNAGVTLCSVGDSCGIRWNVNNFEVVGGGTNKPVLVTYYGATAFARFYGYDLPTDVEWEKAARGPDNDDQDEHLCYPWGNTCSSAYADMSGNLQNVGYYDGNQTPVGPDTINGYGLYDVIGNASEWTRTTYSTTVAEYNTQESLTEFINHPFRYAYDFYENRIYRGQGGQKLYVRSHDALGGNSCVYYQRGFRVARRYGAQDVRVRVNKTFDYNDNVADFVQDGVAVVSGVEGNALKCVKSNGLYAEIYHGFESQRVSYFTAQFKNTSDVARSVYLKVEGNYCFSTEVIELPPNMTEFKTIYFDGVTRANCVYVYMKSGVVIDNLRLHVAE